MCSPGFYGQNGELCLPCPPDTYCLGGSVSTACPSNTVSGAQSDSLEDCDCAPGYYGLGGAGSCTLCPADHYCIGNQATEAACPGNTSSPAGEAPQPSMQPPLQPHAAHPTLFSAPLQPPLQPHPAIFPACN